MRKTTKNDDVQAVKAEVARCEEELLAAEEAAKVARKKLDEAWRQRTEAYKKADDMLPQCEVECLAPLISATASLFRGVILRKTKAGSLVVRLHGVPTAEQRIFKQFKGMEGFLCYGSRMTKYRLKSVPPEFLPEGGA